MTKRRIAAPLAATVIALAITGTGAALAASSVNVPNSGGQLAGTVRICVNGADESKQYVELEHPAPGNCAAGYLQYTANAPASPAASAPPALVNSETFKTASTAGETFTVAIPAGSHVVAGTVAATDLSASAAVPDTVTVASTDTVTGAVAVTYSAGAIGHQVQITYDYAFG